jgi:hypothetical protein
MPPKKPSQLREELERQNEQPAKPGYQRTAEGMEVPVPTWREVLGNLTKLSKPHEKR